MSLPRDQINISQPSPVPWNAARKSQIGSDAHATSWQRGSVAASSVQQVQLSPSHTIEGAIRNSPIATIQSLHVSCVSMDASNLYSESLLHRAAKRGSFEVVDFLLKCGADIDVVDDCGRIPLRDACWRIETDFNIIALLFDKKTRYA